jgi:DNA-binding transcriptional MerR regulator
MQLTTQQAAERLNLSVRTLEAWRRRPASHQPIVPRYDGYRYMYDEKQIDDLIEQSIGQRYRPVSA